MDGLTLLRPVNHPDFLVIGGVSIARELKTRPANANVFVLEKERALGMDSIGCNSGVLRAGF